MSASNDKTEAFLFRALGAAVLGLCIAIVLFAVAGVYTTFVLEPARVRAMQTAAEKGHLVMTQEAK